MVYQTVKLADGRTATLDWLKEDELSEVVEALNSVIREGKYLFMNNEIPTWKKNADGLSEQQKKE